MIIGIDSGRKGAIGYIFDNGEYFSVIDMPNRVKSALFVKKRYDATSVFIEKVMPFRGASPKSILTMGMYYERALMIAEILAEYSINKCQIYEVYPKNRNKDNDLPGWKKYLGLDKDKTKSIMMAKAIWPDAPIEKKHDGRAEALLIAEYGRQIMAERGL